MKKYLLIVIFFSLVLFWCNKNDPSDIHVSEISDLPALQAVILQVSEDITTWRILPKQAQKLINQLQERYVELMDNADKNIEDTFDVIQKTFDKESLASYSLPLWAKKLWMIEPKGMELNTTLSTPYRVDDAGYDTTILVYKWNYIIAMQQAKAIADKAGLSVSKNFQDAQSLARMGNVDYISGLDIDGLSQWIVYINHELLDTNVDQLLSVAVDQDGTLTIETTNYQLAPNNLETSNSTTAISDTLRKQGETCGETTGQCEAWLKCSYPCGIQGCENICESEDELPKP